ncbi:lipooligosaccharide transport system permease protein [Jatrophihabitans endophyticus]|uniref:Transport permease protein n=1 Tax=Jatrophihabitans endophyticus TaxID=1206085 RepID=A0A1M5RTY6_9ACTN|nr:ABC transporter permease [Jatrophihabitans endophyticus]SHH29782.1 lipooligosaccharide transport system permease protein [Jatrophihabitans endophyticus]
MALAAPAAGSVWMVVELNVRRLRGYWRNALIIGVFTPVAFVLALGVGLGTLVNRHGTGSLGVPYLVFVGPALLVASALQIAASDASFPVMAGFKWVRNFHGLAATPLTPSQIADGTLLWITVRQLVNSTVYLAIIAAFGGTQRWWVVLAVPAAVLTAVAFAAPVMALAATATAEGQAFNVLFRFVVTPMFLFSGTFYPVAQLPDWGRWLAYVSPLWHGVELARGAAIGHLAAAPAAVHVGYLLGWLVAGMLLARWRFTVRVARG